MLKSSSLYGVGADYEDFKNVRILSIQHSTQELFRVFPLSKIQTTPGKYSPSCFGILLMPSLQVRQEEQLELFPFPSAKETLASRNLQLK